jgi:hypothetical protein
MNIVTINIQKFNYKNLRKCLWNLTFLIILFLLSFSPPKVEAASNDFEIVNGTLIEYYGNESNIVIPSSVTSIGNGAFSNKQNIKSIVVPDSVVHIGRSAFYQCRSLTSVKLPDSLKSIGEQAFYQCISLKKLTIPESVNEIGAEAFRETAWLIQQKDPLVIVNGIVIDGTRCTGDVTIPDTVTSIADKAFYSADNIVNVTFPNTVTRIGAYAFANSEGLESVILSDAIISIGEGAFYDSTVNNITIPKSLKSIGANAFFGSLWLLYKQRENPLVIVNNILITEFGIVTLIK